jgi:hypothetical protein
VHTLRYASLAIRLRVALYIFLLLLALPTITRCLSRFFNRLFGPHSALSCFFSFGMSNEVAVCLCHGWDLRQLRLHEDLLLYAQRASSMLPLRLAQWSSSLTCRGKKYRKNFCCEVRNPYIGGIQHHTLLRFAQLADVVKKALFHTQVSQKLLRGWRPRLAMNDGLDFNITITALSSSNFEHFHLAAIFSLTTPSDCPPQRLRDRSWVFLPGELDAFWIDNCGRERRVWN